MKVLGMDIGGSGIKGAIINTKNGEMISERVRIETPVPATAGSIVEACKKLAQELEWTGPIGVGFPGVVKQGTVHTAANLAADCVGINFQETLEAETGSAVAVLNDADSVGLAEAAFGAGRGRNEGVVLVVTLGTGIGSALVVRGIVVPNTEFGHIYYRNKIIWEKYAADSARKREELKWPEWGKRVNKYLKEVARLTWPDIIIVGGGASKKFDKFKDELKLPIPVIPAELLNNAGIIGAALYASQVIPTRPKRAQKKVTRASRP